MEVEGEGTGAGVGFRVRRDDDGVASAARVAELGSYVNFPSSALRMLVVNLTSAFLLTCPDRASALAASRLRTSRLACAFTFRAEVDRYPGGSASLDERNMPVERAMGPATYDIPLGSTTRPSSTLPSTCTRSAAS